MINNLTHDNTVDDLKAVLFSLTGTEPCRIRILKGYPPTPLDLSDGSAKLSILLPQTRDSLIVEESKPAPVDFTDARVCPSSGSTSKQPSTSTSSSRLENTSSVTREDGGILMRRVVPANNSCLFTSVNFCISGGEFDENAGRHLRQIIASSVSADPELYNEGFLGQANKNYCQWILDPDHWGGAIELSILSKHYRIEIVAVDTQNVRLNRFGEDKNYSQRILLIYDGIHYDPLMLELNCNGETVRHTIFSSSQDEILAMALQLANEAKASRQYTDVQNFSLKCLVCGAGLRGQEEARHHAKETGHTNFGEV